MTNTYLLEIVKVMDPEVREEMALYLESPLFNSGASANALKSLYRTFLEAAPGFSAEDLNKETVYFKVFQEESIVKGKLEKLMMDLNRVLRNVILCKQYVSESNENQLQVDWVSWLREQGLVDRAQTQLSKLKKHKKEEGIESLEQYKIDLIVAEEEHFLLSIQNQVNGDLKIPELFRRLDLYFQNYQIELANRYALQQKGIPLPELDVKAKDAQYYRGASLLYDISYQIGALLEKDLPPTDEFQKLLVVLKENENRISPQTLSQLYTYLRNLCTLLINGGQIEFAYLLHQIHQDNLDRGLFFINGELSPNSYINIVQIAIRAKEYNWAKAFTEAYRKKIIGGDKEHFFYRSNLAHCLFAEGKWEDALSQMPEPSSHSHYHGMIRLLELKAYYELRSDLLSYKMYAFRKYFERTAAKVVPANLRSMYIEFFNILLQITQSPLKDKVRSQRIIERIQKKKLLADRAWLLEKAKELG